MRRVVNSGILRLARRAGFDIVPLDAPPAALPPAAPPTPPPLAPPLPAPDEAAPPQPPPYTVLSEWDYVRMLPARFPLRVFVNGFPGAGNVILQHVCDELLRSAAPARRKPADEDFETPLIAFLGPRYDRFREMLIACCPPDWRDNWYFNLHRGGGLVDFVASPSSERFLYAGPFVLGAHLNTNRHASHELPSRASYELYAGYGYRILPIVRHPLDILVSLAGKSPLSSDEEAATQGAPDAAARRLEQAARSRAAQARLNDDGWLRLAAAALTRFFAEQAKLQRTWPALRFEDALADPIGFVASLARHLGLEVAGKRVAEIAGAIGAKQLAPGHFGQPSCGKWRTALTPDRLHFLERFGLFETAEEFGYPRPDAAELVGASGPGAPPATPRELSNRLRFLQFHFFAQTFDPDWVVAAAGLDEVKFARVGAIRLFGSNHSVLGHFRQKLARTALDALQKSA